MRGCGFHVPRWVGPRAWMRFDDAWHQIPTQLDPFLEFRRSFHTLSTDTKPHWSCIQLPAAQLLGVASSQSYDWKSENTGLHHPTVIQIETTGFSQMRARDAGGTPPVPRHPAFILGANLPHRCLSSIVQRAFHYPKVTAAERLPSLLR